MRTFLSLVVPALAFSGSPQQHPDFSVWSPPVAIDQFYGPASSPRVAVAPKGAPNEGTVFVAWRQLYYDGSYNSVFAAAIHPAIGMVGPVPLDSYTGEVYDFDLAAGADGGAWVVFQQPLTLNVYSIFAAPYAPSSGWGSAVFLESGSGDAQGPRIAAAPDGNYTAVFAQKMGGVYRLMACRIEPGGGWSPPVTIDGPLTGYFPSEPALAVSPDGTVTVVFRMGQSSYPYWSQIFATQWKPGAGWDPNPALVDAGYALNPDVAADAGGKVMAVFRKTDYLVHASSLSPGETWTPAEPLETGHDSASPRIAAGPHGVFHAVWSKLFLDDGEFGIAASRYDPVGGWQKEPVPIEPFGFWGFRPRIAVGPEGTAAAVWATTPPPTTHEGSGPDAFSNFLPPNGDWDPAKVQAIADLPGPVPNTGEPVIAAMPDGGFVAVWCQYRSDLGGGPNVFVSRTTRR